MPTDRYQPGISIVSINLNKNSMKYTFGILSKGASKLLEIRLLIYLFTLPLQLTNCNKNNFKGRTICHDEHRS